MFGSGRHPQVVTPMSSTLDTAALLRELAAKRGEFLAFVERRVGELSLNNGFISIENNFLDVLVAHLVRDPRVYALAVQAELQPRHFDEMDFVYGAIWCVTRQHMEEYGTLPSKSRVSRLMW